MPLKDDLKKIEEDVERICGYDPQKFSEAEAQELFELVQNIEEKLTTLLATAGIEIGDERVD